MPGTEQSLPRFLALPPFPSRGITKTLYFVYGFLQSWARLHVFLVSTVCHVPGTPLPYSCSFAIPQQREMVKDTDCIRLPEFGSRLLHVLAMWLSNCYLKCLSFLLSYEGSDLLYLLEILLLLNDLIYAISASKSTWQHSKGSIITTQRTG